MGTFFTASEKLEEILPELTANLTSILLQSMSLKLAAAKNMTFVQKNAKSYPIFLRSHAIGNFITTSSFFGTGKRILAVHHSIGPQRIIALGNAYEFLFARII